MNARDAVLGNVRAALGPDPQEPAVPRSYRAGGQHPPGRPELVDLFRDRLLDYAATVHDADEAELPATVARILASRDARRVVVPSGVPADWVSDAVVDDGSLTAIDLDRIDAVLTGCAVAIAETGTIVLDGGPDQGRRALTLIPDLHICVVRADQVVQTVPEALARLDPTRPLTFISGPSATSDIELDRVEGVHGPRTLEVLLLPPGVDIQPERGPRE